MNLSFFQSSINIDNKNIKFVFAWGKEEIIISYIYESLYPAWTINCFPDVRKA